MLVITIKPKKVRTRAANGKVVTVFHARARLYGKVLRLSECAGAQVEDVKIVLNRLFRRRELYLTHELKKGILEFLAVHSTNKPDSHYGFDCYSFVGLVFNVEVVRHEGLYARWDLVKMEREPEIGQAVFQISYGDVQDDFHHAAIYLGFGLYISVYGPKGNLEIAALEDMLTDYGATETMIATPRQIAMCH